MARGKKEDFNFRDFMDGLVLVIDDKAVSVATREFDYAIGDNAVLTYGYIDHHAGLTFEILCAARVNEDGSIEWKKGNSTVSFKMRYDSIEGDVVLLSDELMEKHIEKIKMIQEGYRVNEDVMKARNTVVFDDFRHQQFPDDVLLYFVQEGLQMEGIWCRIEGSEAGRPSAKLLNEPNADFGVHIGESITFEWTKQDEKMVGIARTPWVIATE